MAKIVSLRGGPPQPEPPTVAEWLAGIAATEHVANAINACIVIETADTVLLIESGGLQGDLMRTLGLLQMATATTMAEVQDGDE